MQTLGIFSGSFFKPRPFNDMYPVAGRESAGKQGANSVVRLENHDLNSATPSLKGRVVGIVKMADLESCKLENGSYMINKTLKEHFDTTEEIKNLPKDFEKQYVLPFGTGVALDETTILTAGHNTRTAEENLCVVQYDLQGVYLDKSAVYEISHYISRQDYYDENEKNPTTYVNNLIKGEWTILKLQKPLKGVSGTLPIATSINDFVQGVKTFTLGHPYGLPLKKAEGEIETILQKNQIIRYKADTLPGMSGGPVFDEKNGKLIGLHVRGNINYQFDNRGAVEFVVMLPQIPQIKEMGVYGTFFQNVIPVIEKIGTSRLTVQPSSLNEGQTNSNTQSTSSSASTFQPLKLLAVQDEKDEYLEKMQAEVEARKQRVLKLKKEEEEKERMRKAQEEKARKAEELRLELEGLENEEKQIQSRLVQPSVKPTIPPGPNSSSLSSSSSSISSSSKISPSLNQKVTVPSMAFGKAKWEEYFGNVGVEPPLPANIQSILDGLCPIWSGKKVGETHLLTLIPAKVNGQPLTINSLGKLVVKDFPGDKEYPESKGTGYRYIWSEIVKELGDQTHDKSYWVLMTRDVLPESRNKSYFDQKGMVEKLANQSKQNYEVPKLKEGAVSILMNYYRSGKKERLYNDDPRTWTRCQEQLKGYQTVVGGFAPSGLLVCSSSFDYVRIGVSLGVAASRKFC